ncbi:MAG: short-chain dehydrogenase/reductase [Deltaproteobacteria bacterium]|nr:short-chain dehydrogenase/reductase [Deltaproteobacteria bacterium]
MRLKDKVAIITGAGRGIGKTVALAFARNGADVVAVDLALPPVEATAEEVRALGRRALAVKADVSKWEDVERMAKAAAQELGGIDILINNAGIADIKPKPFFQVTEEEWDKIMSVNLKGVFFCCKAVFPFMKDRGKGKIVNISSGTHFLGAPGLIHYASSKGGIIGFTRTLSREVGDFKITVNSVAPGFTITEGVASLMATPGVDEMAVGRRSIKRRQLPEDLIGAIIFAASEESDFMTGQTIVVDGGVALH